ncbi:MAG: hypothetical protein ACI33K_11270 [Clostridiaceae bacterium]
MESTGTHPYYLLTNNVQRSLDSLIEMHTYCRRLNYFTIFLDIAALAFLAYGFKSFSSLPYNLLYCILSAALISYFGIMIMKGPKEKLKKASEAFKGQLLFDVCDCYDHCHCKKWLRDYLREKHIKL